MFRLFLSLIFLSSSFTIYSQPTYQSSVHIKERAGLEDATFIAWQQIINDASLYGNDSDAKSAKNLYESLDLDTLSQVAKFYNFSDFLPYKKGLVRLNQIIYRINTHAYPAN